MSPINVLVAASSPDIQAGAIAAAIASRTDMALVEGRVISAAEVSFLLKSLPASPRCALVLVGAGADIVKLGEHWLEERKNLVVLYVDIIDGVVRIVIADVHLNSLLAALRQLIDDAIASPPVRVSRFQLRSEAPGAEPIVPSGADTLKDRPLLNAAIGWVHAVLSNAVKKLVGSSNDIPGLTVTADSIADLLAAPAAFDLIAEVESADVALTRVLAAADVESEPLAAVAQTFNLSPLEFRMLILTLGPELDPRYQRCVGLLLDDVSRRVGTLGLYTALLGAASQVRGDLARTGNLVKWRVFQGPPGTLPPSDEPLRLDAWLAGWVLGERGALNHDPYVRRGMRLTEWAGAGLLREAEDRDRAGSLLCKLQSSENACWTVLAGGDLAGWRALIEHGAQALCLCPIRVDMKYFRGIEVGTPDNEESGIRLGRMARLTDCPLVIDASGLDDSPQEEEWMRLFFAAVSSTECAAAVISKDAARIFRLLGPTTYEIENEALPTSTRLRFVHAAAAGAAAFPTEEVLKAIADQYPLQIDGFEQAMRFARSRSLLSEGSEGDGNRTKIFIAACKEVAAGGDSRLAERIEPIFRLDDVVLPTDRKQQLEEIVDNVRLAPKVLDGWKFSEQLPYGRGVTALFHGPSGTGKTMAALGVVEKLGIHILRIDLSRVVSKYIGDTEKNIDRVFFDAQMSGAALLIDEAEALLGKRSEVKDAHDRYANIEVAYLLQRMEEYDGLAILTTNLRQNLDSAFLRRLRFIIDFPRPDADAREKIWRRCLPFDSHMLDDAAFRQLARKIELTGGHIRQITLRAAFVAASAESKIGLEHIAHASRAEFAKLGLPPAEIDFTQRRKAA